MRIRTPSSHILVLCAVALASLGLVACGNSESTPSTESATTTAQKATETNFTVKKGAVKGYVDSVKVEGGSVLLTGWAASSNMSEVADQVVARVDGKDVAEAVPAVERADVAAYYGKPTLKHSGFLLRIPVSALECSASDSGVDVFGVLGETGSALPLVEGTSAGLAGAC